MFFLNSLGVKLSVKYLEPGPRKSKWSKLTNYFWAGGDDKKKVEK